LRIGCLWLRGSRRACRRRGARRTVLHSIVAVRLHAPKLTFELLVAVLQLLDRARELADLRFKAVETHVEVAAGWGHPAVTGAAVRRGAGLGRRALAVAKQLLEKPKAALALLRRRDAGTQAHSQQREPDCPMRKASHWRYGMPLVESPDVL